MISLIILNIIYLTIASIKNKGIPESISATAYILKPYIFTAYCIVTTLLLLPYWVAVSKESLEYLCFLSCSGILFAGITPHFREDWHKTIHYAAGIVAILSCVIWMYLSGHKYLLLSELCLVSMLSIINFDRFVFYAEVIGLLGLLISFYL